MKSLENKREITKLFREHILGAIAYMHRVKTILI